MEQKNRDRVLMWTNTHLLKGKAMQVPQRSGLYAITDVDRAFGLPVKINILYVGKARNLRRRFSDHSSPWREHNAGLQSLDGSKLLEFWYSEVPCEQLDQLERRLIQQGQPSKNIIKFGGKKND